ncbi:unnamed protein product [Adineta steineri]|uniref:DH domain-containing protein n=1 Tax=Adineta steineri TaxID=433720 RepID=A0A819DKT3_9BILA|nr:unnamed protein product [Adineta steineri]CAF3831113.1 unnamed protein product [Adineta steineri]
MNRRLSKANSITTYDTATLWRALEASSANHQNPTARRWQRAASRLLRQHTIALTPSQNDHLSSPFSGTNIGTGGNGSNNFLDANDSNNERPESNLAFVRRKCDEWLAHGLPKLAQLQTHQLQIDERDLKIEKEWQPFLNEQAKSFMSESIKLQQEAIYEMLSTEVSYIRQILTMTDIFMTSVMILKSHQRDGLLNDIDMDKLFSNIQEVLKANLSFWKDILLPIKLKLEQTGCAMNPSDFKNGFLKFDIYFQSYLHYVLDQKTSAEYFKQKFAKDDLFQYLITWIEANFTNRLSFPDLTIKPLQRLTQYKLLLEAIQKRTHDNQQRNDLQEMIQKVATFVNRVNSKLHSQEQEERVRQISDRIGPYENVSAPPEITSILQEYYRDSFSHRLDLLRDMPLFVRGYRRQIIQQGPMKMKDAKNSQDVYCYLFTDIFLITKGGKRAGTINSSSSTSSSLTSISNDGQFNRGAPTAANKILKSPIRIDRMDVREYDRRGNSNEPNTASFVAIVFSEYNLIECGYLFQTNLSKQWIENIRSTKTNFQLLMEESKMKLQNAHNHTLINSSSSTSSTTTTNSNSNASTIHQSLPSLSSTSETLLDLSTVKHNSDNSSNDEPINNNSNESIRRSSKVESDVFKIVEQARRNSRTDHKNYGRYFTADGTGTHGTNPSSSSSINPSTTKSTPSTAIIKRMSWNNEPMKTNDSPTIPNNDLSNTNSFRSVHSSSGVSSTGSFLFSADEESLTTTTTSSSIPPIMSSITNKNDDLTDELDEFDGKSSSSTVIGTDDYEHSSNTILPHEQIISIPVNSLDLMNSDIIDNINSPHLVSRLSSSSTNTITPSNELPSSVNTHISSPETSLRRTPFASVKKRNQTHTHYRSGFGQQHQAFRRPRVFDENELRASTHTIVYDSSKASNNNNNSSAAIPIRRTIASSSDDNNTMVSSLGGSGNESDYDNNHSVNDYSNIPKYLPTLSTRPIKIPVNDLNQSDELTRTDDLLLGDQNEIVLTNDSTMNHNDNDDRNNYKETHVDLSDDDDDDNDTTTIQSTMTNNNQQSDSNITSLTNPLSNHRISTKTTDNTSSNVQEYRKDPLAARKLFDIRSHLLLNTTLDATEV